MGKPYLFNLTKKGIKWKKKEWKNTLKNHSKLQSDIWRGTFPVIPHSRNTTSFNFPKSFASHLTSFLLRFSSRFFVYTYICFLFTWRPRKSKHYRPSSGSNFFRSSYLNTIRDSNLFDLLFFFLSFPFCRAVITTVPTLPFIFRIFLPVLIPCSIEEVIDRRY